jgi:hypothetical protein
MQFGTLQFPLTDALLTAWNTAENSDLFESSRLVLYLQPDQYRPQIDEVGEPKILSNGTVVTTSQRHGFEVTVADGRAAIYNIIWQLEQTAKAVTGVYTPIVVYDYIWVEPADYSAGYSTRYMRLIGQQMQGGVIVGDSGDRYSQGFTFKMTEIALRN